ncbi:heat shock protein 83 [Solenopsis invicta]|uniref:heat shock protein 83 n=1 Tax=Solenopsis invicta TaxID=13686 RepID=UPI000595E174|nr:heat shock protein 83 [Solenopsis invicta]
MESENQSENKNQQKLSKAKRNFRLDFQFKEWSIFNSLFSHTDIFLRELILNSINALDMVYYFPFIYGKEELVIQIIVNKANRTLTVIDNGIGMTKPQLINNLGVIARSGTKEFMESENRDYIDLFGIGFYSVFLVADKVTVTSKCYRGQQYIWESNSKQLTYSIKKLSHAGAKNRGTKVMLYIKDSEPMYLEESYIKKIIKQYFQFTKYPIQLLKEEVKTENNSTTRELITYEVFNKMESIFTKNIDRVTIKKNNMCIFHLSAKGELKFEALFYISKRTSFDLFKNNMKKKNEVKLYVGGVFITNCEELIPNSLNFINGVIYSEHLPLNIFRETIQCSKVLNLISKKIVQMFFNYIDVLVRDDYYKIFYKEYSKNIKMGIYEDSVNREKLLSLLRYHTSASNEECSLKDYVGRMKQNQKYIYFITGESIEQVENSVFIEALKMRDIEVIYMTDPIDEFLMEKLENFDGKPLMSVIRADMEFFESEAEKMKRMQKAAEFERLCEIMQKILSDKVEKVVVSNRLVTSPCCIVNSKYGWTVNMERIAKMQILHKMPVEYLMAKRQFEINPDHYIIQNFLTKVLTRDNDFDASFRNLVNLLYDTACILSGFILEEPTFVNNVHQLCLLYQGETL